MFHKLLQSGILSQKCLLRKQLLIDISGMNEQLKSMGYQIVIMSGYRPPLVQLIAREAYELMHWRESSFRMFGSPKTWPHCSGGSCDIEIADLQGNILPSKFSENNSMWLCFWESLLQQKEGFLTLYEQEAIQNRRFIYHLMRYLGFYPHLAEYWHYGRGDRLSIYLKNQLTGIGNSAIYGTVLPSKEEIQKLAYLVR